MASFGARLRNTSTERASQQASEQGRSRSPVGQICAPLIKLFLSLLLSLSPAGHLLLPATGLALRAAPICSSHLPRPPPPPPKTRIELGALMKSSTLLAARCTYYRLSSWTRSSSFRSPVARNQKQFNHLRARSRESLSLARSLAAESAPTSGLRLRPLVTGLSPLAASKKVFCFTRPQAVPTSKRISSLLLSSAVCLHNFCLRLGTNMIA